MSDFIGLLDWILVGEFVGPLVGLFDGKSVVGLIGLRVVNSGCDGVGNLVGYFVGLLWGERVGSLVGALVGFRDDREMVDCRVGFMVGRGVWILPQVDLD